MVVSTDSTDEAELKGIVITERELAGKQGATNGRQPVTQPGLTSKAIFGSIRPAHLSLILIGLMWVLPFLIYYHAYPRTTFYQEWSAAMLGLAAMVLLVTPRYWMQPEIPRVTLLPIGLMLIIVVQFALGRVAYFDQAMLGSLYMLWAALLIMLGQRLRQEFGLPALAATLAAFLLLGAEMQAVLGVLQHYRWHTFLDSVLTVKTSSAVYGNIAQPNHYANYLALGLISLGLLYKHWSLRAWQVALLAAPLLFVLVLSGSRSAWLYLLWMAGMAYLWQRRDKSCWPLLRYSLLLLLGFGLMHLVVLIPSLTGADGTVTTFQRLFVVGGSSIRLYLWREGWLMFTQFPWLGAGFGQFAWQHFLLTEQLRVTHITGLYNNAHNLVVQVAAEMGLAGLLVLLSTLVLWLYQAVRMAERTAYDWWAFTVLAVLGIHSMLEYPLWYAYFLGVAAVTLGMLDRTTYRLELRALGRLSVALVLILGLLSLLQMWQGYRKLEALLATRPASAADSENYNQRMRAGMLGVHQQTMMVSMAELFMSNMIDPGSAEHLADKRELNGRVMRYVPIAPVVYREAILSALAGDQALAQLQMTRAIWSYPDDFEMARRQLGALAAKDPAHFAALLEYASPKYEEYQRAVRAR